MYTIAITGSMGSGKSAALAFFDSLGYPTISSDAIVHDLYQTDSYLQAQLQSLVEVPILHESGIDRKTLGALIFNDDRLKSKVEAVVHQAVFERIDKWRGEHQEALIGFVEVPLLFETNAHKHYDQTLLIAIDPLIQEERLMTYRHMTKAEIQRRLASQIPQDVKVSLSDNVIYNNGTYQELTEQLLIYLKEVVNGLRKNTNKS